MTTEIIKLYNFSSSMLKPTVKCDCPCSDNYEVENLISSDPTKLNRGFMAYHVTKPPIQLEFIFYCRIEIVLIKIWTKIGALSSTSFELFTENGCRVGDVTIEDEKEGVVFKLKDFKESSYNGLQVSNLFREYSLQNTRNIKVRITKTNKSAPVIRKIEIFGKPSKYCSLKEIDDIKKMWAGDCGINTKNATSNYSEQNVQDLNNISVVDIPEQFLDVITWDIMALPMVLPSGKIVDQSTIDRHSNIEESHGRMASDPFTGKLYTSTCRPLLDAALKSEIDQFLLKNQHKLEYQKIPRTIGKRPMHNNDNQLRNESKILKLDRITPVTFANVYQSSSTLDDVVQNALKNLTRYSKSTKNPTEMINKCSACDTQEQLYKITKCNHLICLKCFKLETFNNVAKQCKCGVEIINSDLIKFHI